MIVLGAMSGTSTDGVDVAALEFDSSGTPIRCMAYESVTFAPELRDRLLRLQEVPGVFKADEDPLVFMLESRRQLTDAYQSALAALMSSCRLEPGAVAAIGVHGQTLRHRPDLGYTYQMFDPARLAVQMRCPVVADFRSGDVALGGQGAPLVPPFHAAWLATRMQGEAVAVLNLGGFSNLTRIGPNGKVLGGGDCGPANVLMDHWARSRFHRDFDAFGAIAARGVVSDDLLQSFKKHSYFAKAWPKSTGRDDFTIDWLERCIKENPACSADDVMSTLLQLSVDSVADSVRSFSPKALYVCGGGADNTELMRRLRIAVHPAEVVSFEQLGLATGAVEAAAFAWLACRRLLELPSNSPVVTGSSRELSLGAVFLP